MVEHSKAPGRGRRIPLRPRRTVRHGDGRAPRATRSGHRLPAAAQRLAERDVVLHQLFGKHQLII